jgi:hypothetical protein
MPARDVGERFESYRPLRIWRSLDHDRRLKAAAALWSSEHVGQEEIDSAVKAIAEARRFRPHSIRSAPIAKRTAYLATSTNIPDPVASSALFAYHLDHHVPMMSRFLEALGIEHEGGRIADEVEPPTEDRLAQGIEALMGAFDPVDVVIYLKTLVSQDPETWGALADLIEKRELDRPAEPG